MDLSGFSSITNVQAYAAMQAQALKVSMQTKQGQSAARQMGDPKTAPLQGDDKPDYILNGIMARMRGGQRISRGDLIYLSRKSPSLYAKASYMVKIRQEQELSMGRSRSKEEARLAHQKAVTSALTVELAGGSSVDVSGFSGMLGGGGSVGGGIEAISTLAAGTTASTVVDAAASAPAAAAPVTFTPAAAAPTTFTPTAAAEVVAITVVAQEAIAAAVVAQEAIAAAVVAPMGVDSMVFAPESSESLAVAPYEEAPLGGGLLRGLSEDWYYFRNGRRYARLPEKRPNGFAKKI